MKIKNIIYLVFIGILLFIPTICNAETYARPWTSPKKAIYGGASFIAGSYIAKGQDSLYLQRFNVNQKGYYSVNNHQYASDLAYAAKQAVTIYNKYKANGILDAAIHLEIPVFNNMPKYTSHPDLGRKTGSLKYVEDAEFEKELDAQGFPESYRVWIRKLHKQHPSWTFSSICTGLDWNSTVETQSRISLVEKSLCNNGVKAQSYGSWYYPTNEATAYYLDPRNFLDEQNALMFSQLSYNSLYNEAAKQLLKNTFMAGKDPVDKETYSSIYIGAGKAYNINPLYLEAKTILENGTQGSLQTSGATLKYNGATYVGIYNFYSIGATDSAGAAGGVAYAAAGLKSKNGKYTGNIGGDPTIIDIGTSTEYTTKNTCKSNTTTPIVKPKESKTTDDQISSLGLKLTGKNITGLAANTKASDLLTKISNIKIKNSNGKDISKDQIIGTGATITFAGGETYSVIIYGDITKDGEINTADVLKLLRFVTGEEKIDDYQKLACDAYRDGKVDTADALKILKHVTGEEKINQD